jgi:hypothetical protein
MDDIGGGLLAIPRTASAQVERAHFDPANLLHRALLWLETCTSTPAAGPMGSQYCPVAMMILFHAR